MYKLDTVEWNRVTLQRKTGWKDALGGAGQGIASGNLHRKATGKDLGNSKKRTNFASRVNCRTKVALFRRRSEDSTT